MNQGRQSRCALALVSVLAAIAALALAVPAGATAQAAVEEYDLALPDPADPQDRAPAPEPGPDPAAPIDPSVPAPSEDGLSAGGTRTGARTGQAAAPEAVLDQAAARRDVLFERPAQSTEREARSLAAPVADGSLPPLLWLLFGLGAACIIATLMRLRRFAGSVGASRPPVSSSRASS